MCRKQIPSVANSIKTGEPTIKPLSSNSATTAILLVLISHARNPRLEHLPRSRCRWAAAARSELQAIRSPLRPSLRKWPALAGPDSLWGCLNLFDRSHYCYMGKLEVPEGIHVPRSVVTLRQPRQARKPSQPSPLFRRDAARGPLHSDWISAAFAGMKIWR